MYRSRKQLYLCTLSLLRRLSNAIRVIFSTWCSIVIIYHGIYVYHVALHIYLQQCNVSFLLNQNDRSSQYQIAASHFVDLINARPVIQSLKRHFVPRIEPHALLKVIETTECRRSCATWVPLLQNTIFHFEQCVRQCQVQRFSIFLHAAWFFGYVIIKEDLATQTVP